MIEREIEYKVSLTLKYKIKVGPKRRSVEIFWKKKVNLYCKINLKYFLLWAGKFSACLQNNSFKNFPCVFFFIKIKIKNKQPAFYGQSKIKISTSMGIFF